MSDLLDVTISGSGELGEITNIGVADSGITPHNPADGSASVATVSLTGKTTETSQFLASNSVSIDEMNGLGAINATTDTVSVGGDLSTVSGPSVLSRFITGDIAIPAVRTGDPVAALDMAMQLSGERRCSNVYGDGNAYAWTGLADASTSTKTSGLGVLVATNEFTNPRFETLVTPGTLTRTNYATNARAAGGTTTGWLSNKTLTAITDSGYTWVSSPSDASYTYASSNELVIGHYYTASIRVKGDPGTALALHSTDGLTGPWMIDQPFTIPLSGEITIYGVSSNPTGTKYINFGIYAHVGHVILLTDALIEEVSGPGITAGAFYDGDTTDVSPRTYSWDGAQYTSNSLEYTATIAGVTGGYASDAWAKDGTLSLHVPTGDTGTITLTESSTVIITAKDAGQTVTVTGDSATSTSTDEELRVEGTGAVTFGPGDWDIATIVHGHYTGPGFNGYTPSGGISNNTRFYSFNGHTAGFDAYGKLIRQPDDARWVRTLSDVGDLAGVSTGKNMMPPLAGDFYLDGTTNKVYATPKVWDGAFPAFTQRDPFINIPDAGQKAILNFVVPQTGPTRYLDGIIGYKDADVGPLGLRVTINPTAKTVEVSSSSVVTSSTTTITLSTTTISSEVLISLSINYDPVTLTLTVTATVSATDGTGPLSDSYTVGTNPSVLTWFVSEFPTARSVRIDTIPNSWDGWDEPCDAGTSAVSSVTQTVNESPYRGINGSVWDYINAVCAATKTELALVNNTPTLRSIIQTELNISETIGYPTLNPTANKAEKVSLAWAEYDLPLNGKNFSRPYSRYLVENIYSVDVNETSQIRLQTNNSIDWIWQPQPNDVSNIMPYVGRDGYAVSGSDNTPIDPLVWLDYGGSLTAEPTDVEGEILFTLNGPRAEIPGIPSPYKFASEDTPLIVLRYYGFAFGETKSTQMLTGAEPSATTQIEPVTFTTPCATTVKNIWGILSSAAKKYAGPTATVTLTIPTSHALGFGLTEGATFRLRDSIYRVINVTFGIATVQVTAQQYTPYSVFTTELTGKTYGDFQTLWSADDYSYADFAVSPLTTAW